MKLSMGARALHRRLWGLSRKEGYAFSTQLYLAEDLGCSVASVRRYTRELQAAGVVRVRQNGLTNPNHYWVLIEPKLLSEKAHAAQNERSRPINLSVHDRSDIAPQIGHSGQSNPLKESAKQGGTVKSHTIEQQQMPEPASSDACSAKPDTVETVTNLSDVRNRREAVSQLVSHDFTSVEAEKLVREYGPQRISANVRLMLDRVVRGDEVLNRVAFLRAAIRGNYAANQSRSGDRPSRKLIEGRRDDVNASDSRYFDQSDCRQDPGRDTICDALGVAEDSWRSLV